MLNNSPRWGAAGAGGLLTRDCREGYVEQVPGGCVAAPENTGPTLRDQQSRSWVLTPQK